MSKNVANDRHLQRRQIKNKITSSKVCLKEANICITKQKQFLMTGL